MEQINAPYNFVPLSEKVVTPEWAEQVSHDLPFKDGISGELALTISTLSNVMVGGEQRQATENEAGQVHFFKTPSTDEHPNGQFAIPGSGLRGAIRSVFEIATYSKMDKLDEKRFGLRDITGKHVADSYKNRVQNNVKYGFMKLDEQGKPSITPCKMVKLSHRWLEKALNMEPLIFKAGDSVKTKYATWADVCHKQNCSTPYRVKADCDTDNITKIFEGDKQGFPVFTGQISAEKVGTHKFGKKYKGRPKYQDYLFYDRDDSSSVVIEPSTWADFLFIHGDEDSKKDMPWPDFWKDKFWNREEVPVFYIETLGRLQIGLSYMPKLAGDFSTHDMVKHTDSKHLDSSIHDFTSLVFGQVGEEPNDAIKSRVSFEPAFLDGKAEVNDRPQATILSAPKPSYFPNYIYQETNHADRLSNNQYATYVHSSSNQAPQLRGWKRYPVRHGSEVKVQALTKEQSQSTNVQTRLHNLKAGAVFKSRLSFHNLKPIELGALLWVLQLENNRHSIGMAKSFGYGQVEIKFDWNTSLIQCNDLANQVSTEYDDYIQQFKSYMTEIIEEEWQESVSISSLLAMSDVNSRSQFSGDLVHMKMELKKKVNHFVDAKKEGLSLENYVKDERQLKLQSHVFAKPPKEFETEELFTEWESAKLHFQVGADVLTATAGSEKAIMKGAEAKAFYVDLGTKPQKKIRKGDLVKSVKVKSLGNQNTILEVL